MSPPDLFAAAVAQARAGRFAEAEQTLARLLAGAPRNARALGMLGSLRLQAGRPAEALAAFDRALAVTPDAAATHANRGAALAALDRTAEALAAFDAAVRHDPALAVAHANRARMLNLLDRPDEALESADRAVSLQPDLVNGWAHRGAALYGLERLEAALEAYRTALRHAPPAQQAERLADVGMTLFALQRYDEAQAALDAAIQAEPGHATAHYRRSLVRLIGGDFAGGFDDYEWRWRTPLFTDHAAGAVTSEVRRRLTTAPTPDAFAGRTLVVAEQGTGDEIMFAGVLPDLLAVAGGPVTLLVDPRLVRLMSHAFPAVDVRPRQDLERLDLDAFDTVAALGSLAAAFRRTRAAFPGTPYLAPRPEARAAWAARLGPRTTPLRVGLSWRGGLKRTRGPARSLPLADLEPLLMRPDCTFVSLQYGDAAPEVEAANARLPRPIRLFPPAQIDDFEDLAALTAELDVVVTVQTTLAHLTGAIGQRGLVMIPQRPEWRYMAAGPTLPWYGSLDLFRQDPGQDWGPVITRVGQALDRLAAEDGRDLEHTPA